MVTEVRFGKTGSVAATTDIDRGIQLVTFKLDDQEYALDIANVVQVVRMVTTTPMPETPKIVRGVINVRGKVIPVIDVRKRFNLPARTCDLDTQLLIAQTDGRLLTLIVDAVSELLTMPAGSIEPPSEIAPQMERLSAVGKLGDRLLLMLDLDRVLTVQEERRLKAVLAD